MRVLLVLFFSLISYQSFALSIDKMVLVGDKAGNGVFTLHNNNSYTSYITGTITKIDVQGEEVIENKYDESNFEDWEITLTHPKLILESTRIKQVGVRSLCGLKCNFERDHVYQVNFVPVPYADESGEAPIVAVNIGYAPLYIIPAEKQDIDYYIRNEGDEIYVENKGNTFFRVGIDQCEEEIKDNCRTAYTVLAGRIKRFSLPEAAQSDVLNVIIVNHDDSYVRRFKLKRE